MPLVIVLGILKGNSAIERVLQRFPQNVGVLYNFTYLLVMSPQDGWIYVHFYRICFTVTTKSVLTCNRRHE